MNQNVDLRELAIDRGGSGELRVQARRHVITRFVLPLSLMLGFLLLVVWSSRDLIFPPTAVSVVPVFSSTSQVRQEGTPLFNAAGWIEPRPTHVRIAALAPGVVNQLLVVEDQPVKIGQPIAELVKDDAQLVLDQAKANLALRLAELDQAKAGLAAAETRFRQPVHLEAALGESEAALAKIKTQLTKLPFEIRRAAADLKTLQQDFEGKTASAGVVAGIEIDIARSKTISADAWIGELRDRKTSLGKELQAVQERRNAMNTRLELLADEIKAKDEAAAKVRAAHARVLQANVVLAEKQLQLERMTVVAPMDGRVFRLIAHPGARIGSGMTQMTGHDGSTVVTMYQPHMLQVRVDVRFDDIPKVSLHQQVEIDNAALSRPLIGKVLFVSSEADIQKNTLQVKVEIPDPPAVFKPEMYVDVTFLAPKRSEQDSPQTTALKIYVLKQLIHTDQGNSFVWLADQLKGIAKKTVIQTGDESTNGLIEVTSGLTISSRIISRGADHLKDGDRITIEGEDKTGTQSSGSLDQAPPDPSEK